jgi:hypothetical protein
MSGMDELTTYDPFATAEDFATFARRNLSAPDTATVEDLLKGASNAIRRHCEWQIWPQVAGDELTLDGDGGSSQLLPVTKVIEVIRVVECGIELSSTDYSWSALGWLRRKGGCWTREDRGLVITLTHGYADKPFELVELACSVAARQFASPLGATYELAGSVAVNHSQTGPTMAGGVTLTNREIDALTFYRGGDR